MNVITYLRLRTFGNDNKGQDLVEYALLVALIALGAYVALGQAEDGISAAFSGIVTKLSSAMGS